MKDHRCRVCFIRPKLNINATVTFVLAITSFGYFQGVPLISCTEIYGAKGYGV